MTARSTATTPSTPMTVPTLDELTAEAKAMRAALGADLWLDALIHYDAATEVIVVPATDIGEQTGRTLFEVIANVVPQIHTRFGPARTILVIDDDGDELRLLYATAATCKLRTVAYYRRDDDSIVWGDTVTMTGPTAEFGDVLVTAGAGAAIAACFHEPGAFN